jgi:hypothetical protein
MLVVYNTCTDFIRTIPSLCLKDTVGEDLDDGQEDHGYDDACHVCMARPMGTDMEEYSHRVEKDLARQRVQAMDPDARAAALDYAKVIHGLAIDQEIDYRDNFLLDPEVYADDIFIN